MDAYLASAHLAREHVDGNSKQPRGRARPWFLCLPAADSTRGAPAGPGCVSAACGAARVHSCLLCISLDALILSNYKEFLINFVASAPKDLLSERASYFNLVILLLFVFKGQTAKKGGGGGRSCWNWGWGVGLGGGEGKGSRQTWDLCMRLHPPACAWRQLAAYSHDSRVVPSHTEQAPGRDASAANLSRSL